MSIIKRQGFTLIELIVVIAIISILVLLGSGLYKGYTKDATIAKHLTYIKELESASERFYMKEGRWPRVGDVALTAEQIETYSENIMDLTGQEVELEDGNYYEIAYDDLAKYTKIPEDRSNYILQNPVGSVYYLENLTEIGIHREGPTAVINMTSSNPIKSSTVINWDSSSSYSDKGLDIVGEEWENKHLKYDAGTHTVRLRVRDSEGTWSYWVEKILYVEAEPVSVIPPVVNGRMPENVESITASSYTDWGGSGTISHTYYPWEVFDGKYDIRHNGWMSQEQSNGWIQVTFKQPEAINMVKMVNSSNVYAIGEYRCKDFRIEYFDGTWKTATQGSMLGETGWQEFEFEQVGAYTKWRIFIINHGYGSAAYLGLGEMQMLTR